jgi:hypothetical protein
LIAKEGSQRGQAKRKAESCPLTAEADRAYHAMAEARGWPYARVWAAARAWWKPTGPANGNDARAEAEAVFAGRGEAGR